MTTALLTIYTPAQLGQFETDHIIKRRRMVGVQLLIDLVTAPKRDKACILEEIAANQRQIRGRQITLLKTVQSLVAAYRADPNCTPELWISCERVPECVKSSFLTTLKSL